MQDRYRPAATPAEIREGADQTIARLKTLTVDYQTRGIDLARWHVDPIEGSHANLVVARDLVTSTDPLRTLTQTSLTLENVGDYYPAVKILHDRRLASSRVGIITPRSIYTLTDQRIDTIFKGEHDVPKRVRLLEKFGRETPEKLIRKAMSEAEQEARRGRTIFSRFTGRSR